MPLKMGSGLRQNDEGKAVQGGKPGFPSLAFTGARLRAGLSPAWLYRRA
jgi:hypothetical protein